MKKNNEGNMTKDSSIVSLPIAKASPFTLAGLSVDRTEEGAQWKQIQQSPRYG